MLKDVLDRIDQRLEALKISATKASKEAGLGEDAIRNMRRAVEADDRKGVSTNTLLALAPVLKTTAAWLLEGVGTGDPLPDTVRMPICFEVAAGSWEPVDEIRDEPFGYYEAAHRLPGYEGVRQWLERVKGDSYNREIPEGFLVHVVDAIDLEYAPRHGDTVIIRRTRAQGSFVERSIKQVVLTPFGVEFWPRSYNPRWDEPLKFQPDSGDAEDLEVQIVGIVVKAYKDFQSN